MFCRNCDGEMNQLVKTDMREVHWCIQCGTTRDSGPLSTYWNGPVLFVRLAKSLLNSETARIDAVHEIGQRTRLKDVAIHHAKFTRSERKETSDVK